jgi:hypothetical protein
VRGWMIGGCLFRVVQLIFASALEYMSFRTEVLRWISRGLDTILSHELSLFRGAGFAGGERDSQDWMWIRGD